MYRFANTGKRKQEKHQDLKKSAKKNVLGGRDLFRKEEHFMIAPKHPGMGRR